MNAITFDTYKIVKRLVAEGLPESQANAIVETISELKHSDYSWLATKDDLKLLKSELRTEIADLKTELKTEIAEIRTEIAELKTELKSDIKDLKSDILKWVFGAFFGGFVAMIGLMVTILLKLH